MTYCSNIQPNKIIHKRAENKKSKIVRTMILIFLFVFFFLIVNALTSTHYWNESWEHELYLKGFALINLFFVS